MGNLSPALASMVVLSASAVTCAKGEPALREEALADGGTRRLVNSVEAPRPAENVTIGRCYLIRSGSTYAALEFRGTFERHVLNDPKEEGMTYTCTYQTDGTGQLHDAPRTIGEVYERAALYLADGAPPAENLATGGALEIRCGSLPLRWSGPDLLYFRHAESKRSVEIASTARPCAEMPSVFAPNLVWQRAPDVP